ncbi:MAG: hypothetical protein CL840_05780 [Crocinitomicaceae bacterium]|nr:hypothetical protein [Crocinitomicaceae bacterium]|tara:strand:- start:8248 stop:9672 length:1425 start_codon:yes stop_codon:yes gene_type:complete
MHKLNLQLNIFVFAFACALTIPVLVQQGMFMDGVLYASVAKNMAEGYGSFFEPRFSEVGIAESPIFYEHPPLVFGIQSLFFRLFNSHFLSERIYSFTTLLVTILLFRALWKEVSFHIKGIEKMDWLAIFIWLTIPLVYWGYQNNAQENTMGIFTMCAALFTIKYLFRSKPKLYWPILAGIFTFLASYSKGVPGLFTLGIIPIHFLVFRNHSIKKYLSSFLIIACTLALCYLAIFAYEPAREHLLNYVNLRLLGRITEYPTVHSRFVILERIFWELIYVAALAALILFLLRKRLKEFNWVSSQKRFIIFFFLIGISASAPVALTMVQKGFYILPSFPYYAISIALLVAYGLQSRLQTIKNEKKVSNVFTIINVVTFVTIIGISYSLYGKFNRHETRLKTVEQIKKHIPERSTIGIYHNLWEDWEFQCYMIRYGTYSLNYRKLQDYHLTQDSVPNGYTLIEQLPKYQLYRKNSIEL